ncbi:MULTISPECIES: undecaprenyldiphospho-muramoylpentapeptide beta-N-acetylglucosaminyltransferase [unclassified Fibrobacter]|uniref:undecaprenyldiphospho-muramoylpentapeptide beta-N-acetylglucosaminyltransferase n=1 Tax=unclassified Fibrobacter TaxID=2634177 RepID=UPI000D6AF2EE|nr:MULTISPECIES: undecaprenyldiphospho-muramoylpentapeptide beta-N-acetylglucosaminyltransferase [unclassified Fibrobacter]PWJ69055.1 UDP-N-acetylglucosamine-N-acetylmuramylpentapeptide N-acetylglucosamine transferase [Fibrobacter sp. UWR4]PZW72886.1 UDP-N-acetylglucosamine-N-acetylmuramylpentapeptide N-acetylglucosamine transferase [Fibrobacter sp. UWR1]
MKKFLFVCGGTGGHIFPAVAIANSLKKMGVTDITFAGRKGSMEERLVAKDWPYEYISAVPLHRGPFLKNLALPFNLTKALVRAKSVVKKVKPDVVVATGGYVSLPIVLAAGSMGIPVYLQEQNAVAGVANKVGSRYAKTIFVTSDDAAKAFPAEKCMVFGNPVRELPTEDSLPRPMEFREGKKAVFIVGGSQGAVGINNKIEESIKTIAARDDVSVVWQVGVKNVETINNRVGNVNNVAVRGFLDGIYSYMKHADLIISRAGASALAEILAFGKPSILLPFPHATANHQEHNARVVEKAGAALVELDADENHLWEKVERLLADEDGLKKMAAAAKSLGMPDAADQIAKVILSKENA